MPASLAYGRRLCRRLLIFLFIVFSLGTLLFVYLLSTYLPRRSGEALEITLPQLVGTVLAENDERLPSSHYEIIYDYRPDTSHEVGTVLAQDPAPNAVRRVIPGRSPCVLRLVVSTGAAQHTLPAVMGKSAQEIVQLLKSWGLQVQLITAVRNDLAPGQVIGMDPPEGAIVREGEAVTLTQSTVTTHKVVRVPDVSGTEQSLANNALVLRGLRPDDPEREYSATVPPGCVISQRPLSGTLVPAGSSAHLVISLGGAQEEEMMLENEENEENEENVGGTS
jgi:beta-lactam-binding protein with PASTA domain